MTIWSKEADTISIKSNWDEVPLYINDNLDQFIKSGNKHFIVAPKGCGKTLLLKTKSKKYREERLTSHFYPSNLLCEKIGTGINARSFSPDELIKFQEISQWEILWDLSLSIVILQSLKHEIPSEVINMVGDANSISDIISILLHERGSIYKLQSFLPKFFRPSIRKIRESISLFIDNIDEAFVDHEPVTESSKILKDKLSTVWRNAQLAFVESTKRVHGLNSHIKVFASIRLEALESSYSSTDLQTTEYCTFIEYTINELEKIFVENIRKTEDSALIYPKSSNKLEAFFGFIKIEHPHVFEKIGGGEIVKENVFQYLFRHTLGRPREIIEIGQKLKDENPADRNTIKIKEVIHEKSAMLLNQYKKEVIPFFDNEKYELIKSFANTNILKRTEIQYHTSKQSFEPNLLWDVIEYFYQLGLIGFVTKEPNGNLMQKFRTVSEYAKVRNEKLPNSEYYLMHPSVEEDLKRSNYFFFHNKFTVVGPNYMFHEKSMKKISRCNLHVGAGRLGLGLVAPIFSKLGKLIILQRPRKKWYKINNDFVNLYVNGELVGNFRCLINPADFDATIKAIKDNALVLLITDNENLIRFAVNQATSITTALGTLGASGLKTVIELIEKIDPDRKINVYPFENDFEAVKNLSDRIKLINVNVNVPFVVADRICSKVIRFKRKIDVFAEENYEVVVNCINGDVKDLFEAKDYNIQVTRSLDEYRYFYLRKYYIVNGIHMVLAIYAYSVLLRKKVPYSKWKNYEINLFDEIPATKKAMEIFSVVQIARIILNFELKQFQRFFPGITKKLLFDKLLDYSVNVRNRFSNSPDIIDRVFSLKDRSVIRKKYEERIRKMNEFATKNNDKIEALFTSIGYREINIKDMLIEITKLLDITSKLFLLRK